MCQTSLSRYCCSSEASTCHHGESSAILWWLQIQCNGLVNTPNLFLSNYDIALGHNINYIQQERAEDIRSTSAMPLCPDLMKLLVCHTDANNELRRYFCVAAVSLHKSCKWFYETMLRAQLHSDQMLTSFMSGSAEVDDAKIGWYKPVLCCLNSDPADMRSFGKWTACSLVHVPNAIQGK